MAGASGTLTLGILCLRRVRLSGRETKDIRSSSPSLYALRKTMGQNLPFGGISSKLWYHVKLTRVRICFVNGHAICTKIISDFRFVLLK